MSDMTSACTSVCIDILEKFLTESRKANGQLSFRRDIVASGLDELQQTQIESGSGEVLRLHELS